MATGAPPAPAQGLVLLTAGPGDTLFPAGNAVAVHLSMVFSGYAEPVPNLLWIQLAFALQITRPAAVAADAALIILGNAAVATGGHIPRRRRTAWTHAP